MVVRLDWGSGFEWDLKSGSPKGQVLDLMRVHQWD